MSVGVSFLDGSEIAEAWKSIWPMVAVVVGITLAAWAALSAAYEGRRLREDIGPADH